MWLVGCDRVCLLMKVNGNACQIIFWMIFPFLLQFYWGGGGHYQNMVFVHVLLVPCYTTSSLGFFPNILNPSFSFKTVVFNDNFCSKWWNTKEFQSTIIDWKLYSSYTRQTSTVIIILFFCHISQTYRSVARVAPLSNGAINYFAHVTSDRAI